MARRWFYVRGGTTLGPFSLEQIRSLAGSGQVGRSDSVWKEGTSGWVPAGEVKDLFPDSAEVFSGPTRPCERPGQAVETSAPAGTDSRTGQIFTTRRVVIGGILFLLLAAVLTAVPVFFFQTKDAAGSDPHASNDPAKSVSVEKPATPEPIPSNFEDAIAGDWVGVDHDKRLTFSSGIVTVDGGAQPRFAYHLNVKERIVSWKIEKGGVIRAKLEADGRLHCQKAGPDHDLVFAREWKGGPHVPGEVDKSNR